jgi:hypothetical protein
MQQQQQLCGVCNAEIKTKPYVVMECKHNMHVHCAAELILASRFRCIVCRPTGGPLVLQRTVDTGCDAKHSEQIAAVLRAERADEVRRLRARLPTTACSTRGA